MKKKLELSRETVRNLSEDQLREVEGGMFTAPCSSLVCSVVVSVSIIVTITSRSMKTNGFKPVLGAPDDGTPINN